jgi:hypothetical protein
MTYMHCLRCRRKTPTTGLHTVKSSNGRHQGKGVCGVCKGRKSQFMGRGFLDTFKKVAEIGLPIGKVLGETYLNNRVKN